VVINGSGSATYVLLIHEFFVLVKANFKSVSKVSKFRVNSLSIVYRCAIHNLQTLRLTLIDFSRELTTPDSTVRKIGIEDSAGM